MVLLFRLPSFNTFTQLSCFIVFMDRIQNPESKIRTERRTHYLQQCWVLSIEHCVLDFDEIITKFIWSCSVFSCPLSPLFTLPTRFLFSSDFAMWVNKCESKCNIWSNIIYNNTIIIIYVLLIDRRERERDRKTVKVWFGLVWGKDFYDWIVWTGLNRRNNRKESERTRTKTKTRMPPSPDFYLRSRKMIKDKRRKERRRECIHVEVYSVQCTYITQE